MRWDDIAFRYVDLANDPILKKMLALFIAVQMLRTRKALEDTRDLYQRMVQFFESLPKDEKGKPKVDLLDEPFSQIDSESWEEYKATDTNRLQQSFADQIFPVGFDLVDDLLAKRWSVVAAKEPVFMTSDCPVVMNHPHKQKFGIRTKGTTITFPLSPTRMLLLDDDLSRTPNRYWRLKPGGQHWFNLITWMSSDRFAFAPFDPLLAIENARIAVEKTLARDNAVSHLRPSKCKMGRNDPCDCGSGEKWKQCCGKP